MGNFFPPVEWIRFPFSFILHAELYIWPAGRSIASASIFKTLVTVFQHTDRPLAGK